MARLSTHVLDTACGIPAAGVVIQLHQVIDSQLRHITSATTNADGRTDQPLSLLNGAIPFASLRTGKGPCGVAAFWVRAIDGLPQMGQRVV